ncbi:MAG: NADH-quinone oxidoreductase subunit L, partial [Deltaproteobacteria bacterium]|nr:NADH-quinone oxidoreductase subunit L [Deltaproteobacteria bacterium]
MTASWPDGAMLRAAVLALLAPFVAFVPIMVVPRHRPRLSAGLSLAAVTLSLISAVWILALDQPGGPPVQFTVKWLISGRTVIPFGFLLDPLSLLMLLIVAVISFLVQVYSLGYMAGDPGFSRYYAFQSLFAWAM